MKKKRLLITNLLLFVTTVVLSQTVIVDLEQQRFLGNVSSLNRSKYFNIHDSDGDTTTRPFLETNNVGFGRRFFGPFANYGLGNFPTTPATLNGNVRPVRRFIATANPKNIWRPGYDSNLASNAAVRYFIDEVDTQNRPEYWEPFNEPFVKAFDAVFDQTTGGTNISDREVITLMSEWFRDMAQKIHNTTELSNMKVIGFSDAFPSFERSGFSNWRDRQKKFIDIAGIDMDALSVHPYDGVNITGQANGRSGSNSEAILDLLETYTDQEFGSPKKLAISEFGVIEEGFPVGPSPGFYNEAESAITIRGINSMFFNFFERQDNIEICIPFITGRADFFYNNASEIPDRPYVPALIRPTEVQPTNLNPPYRNNTYVFTYKENFYKLWKDVKGDRASVVSDDIDVQAQVFVDQNTNKVYLALNNLDDTNKNVNLSFLNAPATVSSVTSKSIVVNGMTTPIFDNGTTIGAIPASITLLNGETRILEITYGSAITFNSSIIREKYYGTAANAEVARAPIVKAIAGTDHSFVFTGINKGSQNIGKASLRIGVGVPLEQPFGANQGASEGLNILPDAITINGTSLTVPTNWKGYDQDGRIEFFGLLEVEVPYSALNTGNNTVTIKYNTTEGVTIYNIRDINGGDAFERANVFIASAVLSIEREEGACTETTFYADEDNDGLGDPANSIQNCGPVEGFVDNADDDCPNDASNICVVDIPGTIFAENFIESSPTGQLRSEAGSGNSTGQVIGFILDPDYTDYQIRAASSGIYEFTISAAAGAAFGGDVEILIDNISVGSVNIPPTGTVNFPFNVYQNFVLPNVTIAVGLHDLRLMYTDADTNDGGSDFLFNIDTVTVDLTTPLSTEDFEATTGFKIVKNPVNSELKFTTNRADGETYKIYSISGQLISSGVYNSGINVTRLSRGLYFVEIKNTIAKFIKQ